LEQHGFVPGADRLLHRLLRRRRGGGLLGELVGPPHQGPPGLSLGRRQRGVGLLDQSGQRTIVGALGPTPLQGQLDLSAAETYRARARLGHQRRCRRGPFEQQQELCPAEPEHQVTGCAERTQPAGGLDEAVVTGRTAPDLIDPAEPADVDHQRRGVSVGGGCRQRRQRQECLPVIKPGQRIPDQLGEQRGVREAGEVVQPNQQQSGVVGPQHRKHA
jgi:hypothetical protein